MKDEKATEISHKPDCKYYKNFVNKLKGACEKTFYENIDKPGFVQLLPTNPKPDDWFKMCCCSSDLPHNEGDKIVWINPEERNFAPFFSDIKAGEPIEQKPDLSKIYLPQDLRPEYQGRKFEKCEIISFLLDRDQKWLHVYGS